MGDEGLVTPVPLNGPFQEFFTVWLAAYTAANETYEMLPAVESNQCDCEPATDDNNVHHEQCVNLRVLYKGDPNGLAYAINCVFPADALQEWDIRSPQTWPRDQCSCSLWNKLPTASGTTWLDYIEEPQYDFLAMDSVLDSFRNTDDEFGDGTYEPCHTQPTGSTVPDPTQTPDDEFGDGICEPCHTQPTGSTIPDPTQTPDAENGSLCTFGRPFTATTREYSCNLSTADQLLLVRRTLELWRIADGGDLPYYPDEPPATGWASSVTSRKMTRLERASERQKMNSGKESASHVTRNRLVQRFPTHSRRPIRK